MSLSVKHTGVISASGISESLVNPLDPNFYYEPDNTAWIKIFHHNNPGTYLFASSDTFTSSVYTDTNRWFNIALCNLISTSWELLLIQSLTSGATPEKYRWIQTANPITAVYGDVDAADITKITTSGYTTPGTSYGGIYKNGGNTYITCNNGTSSNWYCAIGCWTAYQSGVPAYNGKVCTTGYMDLYLRIDNLPLLTKASIYNDGLSANSIIEV